MRHLHYSDLIVYLTRQYLKTQCVVIEIAVKFVFYSEPQFGLSALGYRTNMAAQHGGPHERGPAPSVDIKLILR